MKVILNVSEPEIVDSYRHGAIFYEKYTGSYVMLCQLDAGKYGIVGLDGNRFSGTDKIIAGGHEWTLEQCQQMVGVSCKLRPVAPGTVITLTVE